MRLSRSLGAAILALGFTSAALPAAARGLDYEDLRKIVAVQAPSIAPDGTRIVYIRSTIDWKNNRRDTELVLVDVHDGSSRVLTRERMGVTDPRWSPDGTSIAYLAEPEKEKPPQLYVLPMNGGDSHKLTDAPDGVSGYGWRNDGKALVYVAANEAPNKKEIEKHLDSVVITDNSYLTRTTPQPSHLWTIDVTGDHNTRLTDGTWSVMPSSQPAWSPDGKKIYYTRMPDAIFAHIVSQEVYVHDIAAKTDTPVINNVSADQALSHDGSMIAIGVPRHKYIYLTMDVSVRSASDGHELFSASSIDRNAHEYQWMPHDAGLLYEASDGVRNAAWIVSRDGKAKRIELGNVDMTQASVANNGAIAFVGMRPDHYAELYYLAPNASAPKAMTDENKWVESFDLGKPEVFTWKTDLGVNAVGVLTYPVGYVAGKKYPLVLDIHGGPVSTSTWNMSGFEGGSLDQVLAARGFFVFRPNYRGSDNMGDAFLQAIVGDMASGPGRDNLAAVDALRKTGMIDVSRIFVSGWSGGGLQTSWLIGHASFWRAAVSGAAVNDQYAQALLSDINEPFNEAFFNVLPFSKEGRAAYDSESPITYVGQVKTPLLILSDTRDQRVPVPQAFELYQALKQRNVPVRFTAFPRPGHFPTDPVGQEQVLRAWTGWIEQWNK